MDIIKKPSVADSLVERAPPLTVGYSPQFDDIVNHFIAFEQSNKNNGSLNQDFIPFFLWKFEQYNEPTLAGWATETPIDQTIITAFARCLPLMNGRKPLTKLSEIEIIARYTFCVSKIHCLDYLDFIIRVMHIITDHALDYEMTAWADFEEGQALACDGCADEWYSRNYLSKVLEGHDINHALDGAVNVIKRSAKIMEVLGDQYRKVVMQAINLRPQHVAGSYFVSQHVTQ